MHLQNKRHTLVGFVGSSPMLDFDGKQMANAETHERTLKRGLRRFGPSPENVWNAAFEAANVVSRVIGLDRLMVLKQTRRPLHRKAVENLLTQEMFPVRRSAAEEAPVLQEVQRLRSQRAFGVKPSR